MGNKHSLFICFIKQQKQYYSKLVCCVFLFILSFSIFFLFRFFSWLWLYGFYYEHLLLFYCYDFILFVHTDAQNIAGATTHSQNTQNKQRTNDIDENPMNEIKKKAPNWKIISFSKQSPFYQWQ